MKMTIALLLSLFFIVGVFAQKNNVSERRGAQNELSVAQKAELLTKKMTLHLDLTKEQQSKVLVLTEKNLAERAEKKKELINRSESNEKLSANERFKLANERLDAQIVMKNNMKNILNSDQYAKWEAAQLKRKHGRKHYKHHNSDKRQ